MQMSLEVVLERSLYRGVVPEFSVRSWNTQHERRIWGWEKGLVFAFVQQCVFDGG